MRRNNLDITADILEKAMIGAKKTHIVYGCNLNFAIVQKYLSRLMSNELIRFESGQYWTTDKGKDWLTHYVQVANGFMP